jgi:hypothetical protein
MNEYSEAWSDYRRPRNQALIVFPGFFPVLIAVNWLFAHILSQRTAEYLSLALFLVWFFDAMVASARAQVRLCPRCGKRFAEKWWYHKGIFLLERAHIAD